MMKLSESDQNYLRGYARALQDLMYEMIGDNTCAKTYDPCEFWDDDGMLHSYAFDLKDGGRHHPLSQYKNRKEIENLMLYEAVEFIKSESNNAS